MEAAAQPRRRGARVGAARPGRRRRTVGRTGDPGAAERFSVGRGRTPRRHLRAERRDREPPRPVARHVVSPVLVHAAGGAQISPTDPAADERSREEDPAEDADRFLVSVTFRIGRFGVPVIAEFTSPERRTIVMRIVDGEGAGSVVGTPRDTGGPGTRRPPAHSGDRGGDRPLRPVRVRAHPPSRSADHAADALRGDPAVARRPGLRRAAIPDPHSLADGDLGLVRIERDVSRDRGDGLVRLFVGPDRVVHGVAGGGHHAVVAGVALVRAVRRGVGGPQQVAVDVGDRNVLDGRIRRLLQRQRIVGLGDDLAVDPDGDVSPVSLTVIGCCSVGW